MTRFPVCFFVLSCWVNITSSMPSSSVFPHSCIESWLFARDTHCSLGPVSMSVDISTFSPSCTWSYHIFSQRQQIQTSSLILLLLPVRIFQHPLDKCIDTSKINEVEECFQRPMPFRSHTSIFPQQASLGLGMSAERSFTIPAIESGCG